MECVPNFSEGRDMTVIGRIAEAISGIRGIRILDIDPGAAANRTVITFIGSPEAVTEAAFRGVEKAAELIDMRLHHGTHPRMGATDVLPGMWPGGFSPDSVSRATATKLRPTVLNAGVWKSAGTENMKRCLPESQIRNSGPISARRRSLKWRLVQERPLSEPGIS